MEITYDGEISDVHIDTETGEIIVTDEDGTQTAYPIEENEETGQAKSVKIVDSSGDTWIVGSDGKVTKGSQNNGNNTPDGGDQQQFTIEEKLIVEVLEEFEQDLRAWLDVHGKGTLSEEEMRAFLDMPECFPQNEIDVPYLSDKVIPEEKIAPGNLLAKIKARQENKTFLESLVEPFKANNQIDRQQVDQEDWEQLRGITCHAIMEDYVVAEAFTYYVEQQEGVEVSTWSCWPDAVSRYTKFYKKFDDSGMAFQAGTISFLICATSYENNDTETGATAFTLGFSNALLQELDWFALVELTDDVSDITEDDAKALLGCIIESYQLGVDPDHSELSEVAFKCLTGMTMDDMQEAIKDFIADNWDEPYYQGQATAFTLTLLSPFKAKILDKVKKLPKFTKSLPKLNKLSVAKSKDELVTLARSLTGRFAGFKNISKLPDNVLSKLEASNWTDDLLKNLDNDLAEPQLLKALNEQRVEFDSWKVAFDKGIDDIIRSNPDYLKMLDKFPFGTGKKSILDNATDAEWKQILSGKLVDAQNVDDLATIKIKERFGNDTFTGKKFDTDPSGKEFDGITDDYFIEHKSLSSTNTMSSSKRTQMKYQMKACKSAGKDNYLMFEGVRNDDWINNAIKYANDFKVNTKIELNGIIIHDLKF